MSKCKFCKFWEINTSAAGSRGICHNAEGDITLDGMEAHAYAHDDSGLEATLVTGPLFGCILFETKLCKNHEDLFTLLEKTGTDIPEFIEERNAEIVELFETGSCVFTIDIDCEKRKIVCNIKVSEEAE